MDHQESADYGWGNPLLCQKYVGIFIGFMDELIQRKLEPQEAAQTAMDFIGSFIAVNPNQKECTTMTEMIFTPED